MLYRLIRRFYGSIDDVDLKKFLLLSVAFFFTIGSYWLLRPLKDGIFFDLVGGDWQPTVKLVSVSVVLALVLVYSKLIDMVKRHKLFYIIGTFYALIFVCIGYCLLFPSLSKPLLGWVEYCAIESFGSITVALFWSFTLSVTNTSLAKIGFPLIISGAQLGGIVGPSIAYNAKYIGASNLFFMAAFGIMCMVLTIRYFMKVIPLHALRSSKSSHVRNSKTGFWEGIRLLVTRPYLFSIFLLVFLYEILATIVDYQMKVQAHMLPQYAAREDFIAFLGFFGICANIFALFLSIFATNYLLRKLSLRKCLTIFPAVLGIVLTVLYYAFAVMGYRGEPLLWLTVVAMVSVKGISYAFNNPSRDMLYIPTSRDVKFKAKGWIDMFGSRFSKASGAQVCNLLIGPIAVMTELSKLMALMSYGLILALVLIVFWLINIVYVSKRHNVLIKSGETIR